MRDTKSKEREMKRRENKYLFILINRQTDRQRDGQIDRHKSFNDMRYNTEQYSKSDSIESNRME